MQVGKLHIHHGAIMTILMSFSGTYLNLITTSILVCLVLFWSFRNESNLTGRKQLVLRKAPLVFNVEFWQQMNVEVRLCAAIISIPESTW